ncbi:NAGPA-like protein [Mya arenaria]|uniref:NAGPA-like protein n=1 Tax=Mya arenaria TaxID=6604 RepID=A0ABY7EY22_MYAAR|nr:NAGPA-like protein [Mya arenaria]
MVRTATGVHTTAIGSSRTATGVYITTIGTVRTATGVLTTAIGRARTATGVYTTVIGRVKRRHALLSHEVHPELLFTASSSITADADLVCICIKNALLCEHLGHVSSVESTFSHADAPPSTSSTSFNLGALNQHDDRDLAFPYKESRLDTRSIVDCPHYAYQQQNHVLFPAHTGHTLVDDDADDEAVSPKHDQGVTSKPGNREKSSAGVDQQDSVLADKKSLEEGKWTLEARADALEKVLFSLRTGASVSSSTASPERKDSTVVSDSKGAIDLKEASDSKLANDSKITVENNTGGRVVPNLEVFYSSQTVGSYYDKRFVFYHVAYVANPLKTLSVYEPGMEGTCRNGSFQPTTVKDSAEKRNCVLATNAGLFNTHTGACLGNIVSDHRQVQDTGGVRNAHFGITKQGQLFFGYLSQVGLVAEDFTQLVGGVIWVLRNGEPYVDESIRSECPDTEETGTLQRFASVLSARTLVGHDEYGRVMILQVEGKTFSNSGVSLYEAAEILRKHGAVNAVNLDGGGSSTMTTTVFVVRERCPPSSVFMSRPAPPLTVKVMGHVRREGVIALVTGRETTATDLNVPETAVTMESALKRAVYVILVTMETTVPSHAPLVGMAMDVSADVSVNTMRHVTRCQASACVLQASQGNGCMLGFYGDKCSLKCDCKDMCTCDPVSGACNFTYAQNDMVQAKGALGHTNSLMSKT